MDHITIDTKLKYILYGVIIGIFIFFASTYFAAAYTDSHFKPVGNVSAAEGLAQMIGFLIGAWTFSYLGISILVIGILIAAILIVRERSL